jgi:tRNA dimethylallyltransferase
LAGVDVRVVPVICGPTGAGKSALAMALAARIPSTIIVADSRQVYRRLDVGTAKPSPESQRHVPHRGIDIVDPTARYSAAAWARDVESWIAEAEAVGRVPLVVGGTGLYLRALFEPFFEEPDIAPERRRRLDEHLESLPHSELVRWTQALDPVRAHLGRTQLLRAIQVALLSGRRLSALHRERARAACRAPRYLVVDPGQALAGRLLDRIDMMLAGGWVEEVRRLMDELPDDAPAWKSTGYRTVRRLARGELSPAQAREAIFVETRQYAKRQRTWFRHQLPAGAATVDPLAPETLEVADRWLASIVTAGAATP